MVEDDLSPDPGITLGTPDEDSVADWEVSTAGIGPSAPVIPPASVVKQDLSVPVTLTTQVL